MRILPVLSLFVSTSILAACGGGSTGSTAFTATGPLTIANLNEGAEAIFDFGVVYGTGPSVGGNVAALTAKGSASYAGFMFTEPNNFSEILIGRTRINANFANGGSLTGDVTNFALVPEVEGGDSDVFKPIPADTKITSVAGSLVLSDGSFKTVAGVAQISIAVAGNVMLPAASIEADADEAFVVSGEMDAFVTEAGDFVASGDLVGTGPTLTT
ncbi:hypothetical protein, partial [Yoonia sp.]|uniref:hypothetical protein n=1 Tax=Yoonia sp. TaxID=2212373 RepID=UPI0023986F82